MIKWLEDLVIPNWLQSLLIYLVIIGLIFGVVYSIYDFGVSNEHERNVAADNAEIAQYGQQIIDLQSRIREQELANVMAINTLTTEYEKRLTNANIEKNNALRDVKSGARKLRITTQTSVQTSGDSAAKISTIAPPVTESSAELSQSAAEFLIGFASECDATAEKLNLAIDIATQDRSANVVAGAVMNTSIDLTNKEIK